MRVQNRRSCKCRRRRWRQFLPSAFATAAAKNFSDINKPELQATVSAFFIDRQRRYWAVAWPHNNAAVFCFDEKTGRFLPTPPCEGISNSYVEFRTFFQQQNGTFWLYGLQTLMAYAEGTHRFGNAKRTDGLNPVDFNYVNAVYEDAENNLWAATGDGGLYRLCAYNNGVSAHLTASPQGLLSNDVSFIKTLNDTALLIGGPRLQTINPQTLSFSSLTAAGSPLVGIRTAAIDGDKNLWLLAEEQVYKYNLQTQRFAHYGQYEGWLNLKDVGNTAFTASNGRILMAGLNNLLSFHPQDLSSRRPPPPVITDFRLFGKFLPIDSLLSQKRIVLSADQNSFAVFFYGRFFFATAQPFLCVQIGRCRQRLGWRKQDGAGEV